MFRPFRTLILLVFAFLAGVFYERNGHLERCEAKGGRIVDSLCVPEGVS
jgi:hypothetical protein